MNNNGPTFETSGGDIPDYMKVIPQLKIPQNPSQTIRKAEPDYLDYDMKGRGFMERAFANTGLVYLLGVTAGSLHALSTQKSIPSATLKIRLNSFLNGIGRGGSRVGNSVGTMAFMYTAFESLYEQSDVGRFFGDAEILPPLVAASATGFAYGSARGMRAAGLAGVIGGGVVLGTYGITSAVGPIFGFGFQRGNVLFL